MTGTRPAQPAGACWRQIGVFGDGSCAELTAYVHCRNCPRFAAAARGLLARASALPAQAGIAAAEGSGPRAGREGMLVFRLAGLLFALSTSVAAELAPDQRARRIAHRSGRLLEGLVNLRGALHLCVALDRLLGLTRTTGPDPGISPRLVLVRDHLGASWAFRADAVLGVERFDVAAISAPPPAAPPALAPFVRGIASLAARATRLGARRADAGWQGRVVILDGTALLAGLENAVY